MALKGITSTRELCDGSTVVDCGGGYTNLHVIRTLHTHTHTRVHMELVKSE